MVLRAAPASSSQSRTRELATPPGTSTTRPRLGWSWRTRQPSGMPRSTILRRSAALGPVACCTPIDDGRVELIVRRPAENERDVLLEGALDAAEGLVGDTWQERGSGGTSDGSPHPDKQLTMMNARAAALVAGQTGRWGLAGDQ